MLIRRASASAYLPAASSGPWERHGNQIVLLDPPMAPPGRMASYLQELSGWAQEATVAATDHIAWAQRSLNQVMGLALAVDGVPGPLTRRAISAFQQREGLVVDGVLGPVTAAALMAAIAVTQPIGPLGGLIALACVLLDQPSEDIEEFAFADHSLRSFHQPQIANIARCVIASQNTAQPIRSIGLIGHTDPVGTEVFNFQLGLRRAREVKIRILRTIESKSPGLGATLQLFEDSRGETEPIASSNTRSRRVQVVFPTTSMPVAICSCTGFFAEYELRFNPGSPNFGIPANRRISPAQKAQRSADVRAMVAELVPRRDRRASDALAGVTTPASPAAGNVLLIARRLSAGQRDLYRECFPNGAGGINFIALRHCFERFANGDLRNPAAGQAVGERGVGEPDGGLYFLFAEFAFLCLDSGIDVGVWGEALRVFVETQELFMHVYRPAPKLAAPPPVTAVSPPVGARRRGLDAYNNANFNRAGQSNGARRAAARAKYASMGSLALRTAAKDNMVLALCSP